MYVYVVKFIIIDRHYIITKNVVLILKKVKKILEQNDKFPVKVSWGLNYHEMKDITEKFV